MCWRATELEHDIGVPALGDGALEHILTSRGSWDRGVRPKCSWGIATPVLAGIEPFRKSYPALTEPRQAV
jgi:hypothetical protein